MKRFTVKLVTICFYLAVTYVVLWVIFGVDKRFYSGLFGVPWYYVDIFRFFFVLFGLIIGSAYSGSDSNEDDDKGILVSLLEAKAYSEGRLMDVPKYKEFL